VPLRPLAPADAVDRRLGEVKDVLVVPFDGTPRKHPRFPATGITVFAVSPSSWRSIPVGSACLTIGACFLART